MASRVLLRIPRPDDWHLHVRDGSGMKSLMQSAPRVMARAIIMPNLKPPVRTTSEALEYKARILSALPSGSDFEPLMTLYLTDVTSAEEITKAKAAGVVAVKLYPAGATTNSDAGVTDIHRTLPALRRMEELGMPLLVHGEVTAPSVDVFEREPRFLVEVLTPLVTLCPTLKIVLEHITTKESVAFVYEHGDNVAATITAHHLMYNRNALFEGGIRPHKYCLPILKHETDRQALVGAVKSGSPKFFLGTDSAPHSVGTKECACGAAGMFTAHAALELYAGLFQAEGCLDKLKGFACDNGPKFYGLPNNADRLPKSWVELREEEWSVPDTITFGDSVVVPVMAGQKLGLKAHVVDV